MIKSKYSQSVKTVDSKTMKRQVLFLICVALPLLVIGRPTHCDRWKGDSEFRCGKDDYHADSIHIRSISNSKVGFKISKWISECGHPGVNYFDQSYNLRPGDSIDELFSEVNRGSCNELFVYECTLDSRPVNCLDVVSVYPNECV